MAGEAEDTEYLKLPAEDRCVHKLWKARVSGYEEAVKTFPRLDADDANAWRKFSPNIKKFVVDSNAVAQEKGLEATLLYVELCGSAGKLASDITEGLVTKCLGAPKAKTKDLAKQIILMMCEIEVHEKVIEELIKGLAQKNPKVVQGCVSSMTECLKAFGVKVIKVSPLLKAVMPLLDNRDKGIRDDGKQLIVEAYRWVGDLMKQQLSGLKPVQLTELETEFEKIRSDAGRAKPERYLRSQMPTQQASGGDDQADGEEGAAPGDAAAEEERIDPYDLIDPVDIIEKIDKNFYEQIEEKKWQTRKEALDALLPLTKTAKIVPGDFGDLVRALKKVVAKDSNVIVVALAAQCLAGLAKGLRAGFKSYAPACLPVYLEKFKEKKTNVVSALVEAVDALFPVMNIEGVQEDCLASLKHKTPTVISETAKFLARCFLQCPPLLVSNKKVQKGYILALQETLNHPDATVREAASEALGVLFKFLGEQNVMKLIPDLDSIKLAKVKEFADKAELTGKPAAAQQPEPKAKVVKPSSAPGPKVVKPASAPAKATKAPSASAPASSASASAPAEKKVARPATSARPGAAGAAAGKKKVEETDTSPLFAANALKSQRFKEEAKLKVLRWQFSLPRQEFVDQLKDQMATAGFNQTLTAQMFHSDFKQHLKAIEALSKFLSEDPAALVANLDLVLKWLTLRFFETNPQVLLKSLDYLRDVFTMLSSESYSLHDIEASSFVPYLINKVGDPKDQVRNSIKEIFRKLCQVHPASKMSFYLMEGLKSKNAKQRSECLDELGYLIQNYGSSVLQPSPASCLKEIAKQIADRDNSVRNAALNCITETYFQDGERMYKVLGHLPEKDMAMLEERIKRTSKTRPPLPGGPSAPAAPEPQAPLQHSSSGSSLNRPATSQQQRGPPPSASAGAALRMRPNTAPLKQQTAEAGKVASPSKRPISGVFTLDLEKIEAAAEYGLDSNLRLVNHNNLDDIFNDGPVALPQLRTRFSPPSATNAHSVASMKSSTPPSHLRLYHQQPQAAVADMPEAFEALDLVMSQVFNQDANTCLNALTQLDELIKDEGKVQLLAQRLDQLLANCYMQYRYILHTKMKTDNCDERETMRLLQCLTMVLMSLYHHADLTRHATAPTLRDLFQIMVTVLLDPGVHQYTQSAQLFRALNVLTVKIIERSDHTQVTSALIRLLKDSVSSDANNAKDVDLVMKCLWKVIRFLPQWAADETHVLNVDLLLADLHDFLKAYPSSYWKGRESDIPLRTVKTVLHTLVKIKGDSILNNLSKVSDPQNSELVPYMQKLLSSGIGKENAQQNSNAPSASAVVLGSRLPKSQTPIQKFTKTEHEALADIFKKIGQKEQTKQGLRELHAFKTNHPAADLEPFLSKSSQYFRDYIERGLKEIEAEQSRGGGTQQTQQSQNGNANYSRIPGPGLGASANTNTNSARNGDANAQQQQQPMHSQYLERLRMLREKGGLKVDF